MVECGDNDGTMLSTLYVHATWLSRCTPPQTSHIQLFGTTDVKREALSVTGISVTKVRMPK